MTPTQRTLARLRDEGWTAAVTERWNSFAKIRQDLFGFCDVLAIMSAVTPGRGFLAVQCTSGPNVSARVTKLTALPEVRTWLLAGGRCEVWGWSKRGARGQRKTWQVRRVGFQVDGTGRLCDFELEG